MKSINLDDVKREDRRLAILQLLEQDPDYSINNQLLKKLLDRLGHGVGMGVLLTDLAWLETVGLLSLSDIEGCYIAVLRSDGVDAAKGELVVPGISRPRPA